MSTNFLSEKHGLGNTGHQRYRSQGCSQFPLDYEYRACQPGTKDKLLTSR
ncbi:hypothetical protein J4731_01450 [Providencia rettgeri]|nr:hypothetical protein [Providencia rettgeri]